MKKIVRRKEIAEHFGLTPGAIRVWELKGKIKPIGHVQGRPIYDFNEVLKSVITKEEVGYDS